VSSLTAALLALIGAAALVPVCKWIAFRVGCVAAPKSDRWHKRPTPLLGGLALVLPVLFGVIVSGDVAQHATLVACAGLIALVGLIDDVVTLSPATKLVAQIALASLFVFMGYRLHWVESLTLDSLLTLFWVVGITNAFNLLDNMDGLCAGIALIAGTAFLFGSVLGQPAGEAVGGLYLPLLVGAVAGFLVYNVNPASIFMGDTGSLFLGMSLAGVSLESATMAAPGDRSLLAVVAAPVLILMIPILDTTLVTVSRLLSGRSASQGGRDHSSHRLVAIGLSERRAVAVLWGLAALAGVSGFYIRSLDVGSSALIASTLLLAMTVFAVYLMKVRVYEGRDLSLLMDNARVTPLVVNLVYQRRVAEVLLDACLIPIAYYAAYRLRFEGPQYKPNLQYFLQSLPVVVASQIGALFALGAYRGIWQYFSLIDGVTFAKAAFAGTALSVLVVLFLYRFESYSRTVFIIYAVLIFVLLSVSRASFRLIDEFATRRRKLGDRLVVYGAGPGGSLAIRTVANLNAPYRVLGFVDDNPTLQRVRVQGYPVMGTFDRLRQLITNKQVDAVLFSTDAIDADCLAEAEALAAQHGVRVLQLQVTIQHREEPQLTLLDPPAPPAPGVH
jgi:UDP-GlcNAc:undecaprenyl-phosphate/decaprenyl-phosphate GlcNAc-1-phosphate transferase